MQNTMRSLYDHSLWFINMRREPSRKVEKNHAVDAVCDQILNLIIDSVGKWETAKRTGFNIVAVTSARQGVEAMLLINLRMDYHKSVRANATNRCVNADSLIAGCYTARSIDNIAVIYCAARTTRMCVPILTLQNLMHYAMGVYINHGKQRVNRS